MQGAYRALSNAAEFLPLWCARVAQLVEHTIENRSVDGSIPPPGTTSSTSMMNKLLWPLAIVRLLLS